MDAALLDQLESEHRQVEVLFAALATADDEGEQRPLVEELSTALIRHMETEEAEVYPQVATARPRAALRAQPHDCLTVANDYRQALRRCSPRRAAGDAQSRPASPAVASMG